MAITAYNVYDLQLQDFRTGKTISAAGTQVSVLTDGTPDLATLYDPDAGYASKSNKFAATAGKIRFAVASSVAQVDLCVMTPTGQALYLTDWTPGQSQIGYDANQRQNLLIAPFSYAEGVATEVDTGFNIPAGATVPPSPFLKVTAIDATETLDVGLLSSESGGDADGFLAAVSVGTLGLVKGTLLSSGQTLGALLRVDESGAGVLVPEQHLIATAVSVTYTITTGSDTGKGFIAIPYQLGMA